MELADLGSYFKHHGLIHVIDIVIVLILIFQFYRALKGSIAFNIFLGILAFYIAYLVARALDMPLLNEILDRLVSIGLIGLIVVFQPEIRKFLIILGKRTALGKNGYISRMFQSNTFNKYVVEEDVINEVSDAIMYLLKRKLGAIIIIARSEKFEFDTNTGVLINGTVTAKLIESIFEKYSPLHDGAIIIDKNIIIGARIILPISESAEISSSVGLRHRSAVGATEHSDVLAIVVSEEKNFISISKNGKLYQNVALEEVKKEMYNAMIS
jgi:uncharacterized protein (TIGR00159 family)